MKRLMVCLAMLTVGWIAPRLAVAECCNHCGCQCQCSKVCKLVPEVKKVPKVTYGCECEDFCVPGRSCIVGYQCPENDDCDCGRQKRPEPIWQPSCGCVRTRHKLVKIETMKEVKGYKCVVVNLCPHCQALNSKGQLPTANIAADKTSQPSTDQFAADELREEPAADSEQTEASDLQLVSHSSPANLSLVDRFKRSILGVKAPE
jgi:hypothetical protein